VLLRNTAVNSTVESGGSCGHGHHHVGSWGAFTRLLRRSDAANHGNRVPILLCHRWVRPVWRHVPRWSEINPVRTRSGRYRAWRHSVLLFFITASYMDAFL